VSLYRALQLLGGRLLGGVGAEQVVLQEVCGRKVGVAEVALAPDGRDLRLVNPAAAKRSHEEETKSRVVTQNDIKAEATKCHVS
jgi:hypothetical protein